MTQPPEAQLAYLGFHLIPPAPLLRPYIRSYWYFARATPLTTYQEEFMHPTGGYGVVFNFGDPLCLDARPVTTPVFLDGANTMTRRLGFLGHIEVMGIRFYEGGAFPFLRIPLIELQNQPNVLDASHDAALLRLHSRLYEAKTLPTRISLMEGWLMKQLARGTTHSTLIPASLARLRQEIATPSLGWRLSSIPKLADDLAVSQRRLEDLYRSQVGMTPVQYIRLQRVEIARLALKQQKQSNTRLAADLGYFDQAYFIRDFRSVIGTTPYAYMMRKHHASSSSSEE